MWPACAAAASSGAGVRKPQMPSFALVFDFALCLALTAFFFAYFNRILRFGVALTLVASKLGVSFALAITIHTLLQFSSVYVSVAYTGATEHKFGFVRAFAKSVADIATAAAGRRRDDGGDDRYGADL